MKSRVRAAIAVVLLAIGALAAAPAAHAATGVVMSQVAFGGPGGGNDEVVEIRNTTAATIDISGWALWGSNQTGSATSSRAMVPANTTLPAGQTYVFANSAGTFTAQSDVQYGTGIANTGGAQIRDAGGVVRDAFGSNGAPAAWREGAGLAQPSSGAGGFARKNGGTMDTDDNVADFTGPLTPTPTKCGTTCGGPVVPPTCVPGSDGIVAITDIQTLGDGSACEGKTVTVHGIVTGIDDLYGSNFDNVFPADSGIWLQQETRAPGATTSSALFVAGVKREHDPLNPLKPAEIIGDEVTITGRVETKFGQVGIVPPGVGNTGSPLARRSTTTRSSGRTRRRRRSRRRSTSSRHGRSQGTDRTYYRSLQGMRVRLLEGIATGGGTTKFNDVFVEPARRPSACSARTIPRPTIRRGMTRRPRSASRPTAAPATRPTRGCRGRARRRSTWTCSTSSATSPVRSASASATTRSCRS